MKGTKIQFLSGLSLLVSFFLLVSNYNIVFSQVSCPSNTTFGDTFATLVGEIRDTGGDPNITAWFEWGTSSSLGNTTPQQSLFVTSVPFRFCSDLDNLQPCTTYYYRAVAQNSAGTTRGSIEHFTTQCVPLQVFCLASPNPANVNQPVTFTANVSGGTGSYSYSWSGACTGSGSTCSKTFSSPGTYTANLTVTSGSQRQSTSCSVTVRSQISVDLKVNGSNGPLTVNYGSPLNLSWTSTGANFCIASGAWSGSKPTSGFETISNLDAGIYNFDLICEDDLGNQAFDTVGVTVRARLPQVITLPPVTTL